MGDPTPNFRTSRQFLGPSWLVGDGQSGSESQLVWYPLDAVKDALVERLRQGHGARFPQTSKDGTVVAPDDALAAIGRDRKVIRGRSETSQSYAARLVRYLDDRKLAGNPFALMKKLREFTGPGPFFRTVDVNGNWCTRDASDNEFFALRQRNWDWDASDFENFVKWSRFWVIVYPNGLWTKAPRKWGVGHQWGTPGNTWGSTMLPSDVAGLRTVVRDWKPAGTRCVFVILAFNNSDFDPSQPIDGAGLPDGHWGRASKVVNGQYVSARNPNALYMTA